MFEPEKKRVADKIKDYIKNKEPHGNVYIMLRDGRILYISYYRDMVNAGKIKPQDAYVYINIGWNSSRSIFYYPFLYWYDKLFYAYFSKLGFHYGVVVVPATGLKYVASAAIDFYTRKYLSIEVTNLDTAVNDINLRKIVFEVMSIKLISGEKELTDNEFDKIYEVFGSQQLFAGHNFEEARDIIADYYDRGKQSLTKEAARIAMDYVRIFNPYTVRYDMKTWDEVDCWKIKL